jgi:type VI secretion system protein ImpF
MAELTPKERLQPSLLDRLIDDEPGALKEPREARVLSARQLRRCVLRDLDWLLNTSNLDADPALERYPLVRRSVVNYGLPELSGRSVVSMTPKALEAIVRQAILDFEPRILRDSVRVRAVVLPDQMNRNAIGFEIHGVLWGQPVPTQLFLRSEIDLETGHVAVQDSALGVER